MTSLVDSINKQPIMNIGMLGSVADGKSTCVLKLTGTKTQRHSNELKRNITIKPGYANLKIWKDSDDKYHSTNSKSKSYKDCELVHHLSFVDCPGHHELILTMLGEASTTRFTKERNSEKFPGLKKDAKDGGDVAGTARKHLEKKLGKSVMSRTSVLDHAQKSSISDISEENYLKEPEKTKRIEKR